jgi:hypothetical protein
LTHHAIDLAPHLSRDGKINAWSERT